MLSLQPVSILCVRLVRRETFFSIRGLSFVSPVWARCLMYRRWQLFCTNGGKDGGGKECICWESSCLGWTRAHIESHAEDFPHSRAYRALEMLMNFYHVLMKTGIYFNKNHLTKESWKYLTVHRCSFCCCCCLCGFWFQKKVVKRCMKTSTKQRIMTKSQSEFLSWLWVVGWWCFPFA